MERHPQPLSPSSFSFPRRPSSKHAQQLQAPFSLPPRGDSLHRGGGGHQPNLSSASTASSSASSSAASRSTSSPFQRRVSVASTALTSDSYDDCDDEYDCDQESVLEELYGLTRGSTLEEEDGGPPRFAASTVSGMLLRERTRYRSSASLAPAFATTAPLRTSPPPQPDQYASLLASLSLSSLDRCFCGNEPEEDSIYCSRACAQTDALNALCGGSSGAEDSSDAASLRSGSSGGALSGGETHYRRHRREEARKEAEREAMQSKQRREAARRRGGLGSGSSAGSGKKVPGSLWRNDADVSSTRVGSSSSAINPPPRTSSRRTPSLSSSISSLPSSAVPSPLTPAFPPHAHSQAPFVVEPPSPAHDASFHTAPPSPPLRPCTPNPPHHLVPDMSDIYASYLAATPLASEKLRTPTQFGSSSSSSPSTLTPRGRLPLPSGVEDDSPTRSGGGTGSTAAVGLRMLELCGDEGDEEEERDALPEEPQEGGWGARQMKERMRARAPGAYGHQKSKLSFDDVVGILGA
ncbi:hypothetical protein JCM10213_002066 [Rhodosporidiobolus nylandii]